jgi:hypothetical protein
VGRRDGGLVGAVPGRENQEAANGSFESFKGESLGDMDIKECHEGLPTSGELHGEPVSDALVGREPIDREGDARDNTARFVGPDCQGHVAAVAATRAEDQGSVAVEGLRSNVITARHVEFKGDRGGFAAKYVVAVRDGDLPQTNKELQRHRRISDGQSF